MPDVSNNQCFDNWLAKSWRTNKSGNNYERNCSHNRLINIHARLDTVLEMSAVFQAVSHKTPDHSEAVNAFIEKRVARFS